MFWAVAAWAWSGLFLVRPLRALLWERFLQLQVVGVFDSRRLPRPDELNRVPLETYFPPLGTLRYDQTGQPVPPRTVRPTLNTNGYIQSPPQLLTTLDAACALRSDCISAIRVRVADIGALHGAAQHGVWGNGDHGDP